MRFSPLPLFAKITLSLFLIGSVLIPLPYVVLMPGNAVNIGLSFIVFCIE